MPGFNQRGPEGQGPMTGRRMGRCTNFGRGRQNEKISEIGSNESMQDQNRTSPAYWPGARFGKAWGGPGGRRMGRNNRGCGAGRQNRFRGDM
ncbi:MAG: DUF5320 domain-containing protein [Lentimicrobiaceae bacterium]|nr:DUF5320 domain-containing protein [Lentimicrobiaceae bacterium]